MPGIGPLDQLQQVHELNRAFLDLLQTRVRQQRSCLGLPVAAREAVGVAASALLDGVACFPRALFQLTLAAAPGVKLGADFDEAEHELKLSILLAARSTSRHSSYQARLLFGLPAADAERLRASPLSDLQRSACEPGTLNCAFADWPWFWLALFTATRPELRRHLTLLALQPDIECEWPRRRPPQPST